MPKDKGCPGHPLEADTRASGYQRRTTASLVVPGLTLLYHPDLDRIGERALLPGLAFGDEELLSRGQPDFVPPDRPLPRPLEDTYLSRQPVRLTPGPEPGSVRLVCAGSRTPVAANGDHVAEERTFSAAEVERGVVLLLAGRVVLLLSPLTPVSGAGLPRFGLVGEGPAAIRLRREILRVAPVATPVLIRGETGTGKELIARALHQASPRSGKPYLAVNMGAVPASLAAAELFGAARGAFTGADRPREGYFVRAHGGTLFLDEIGETPPEVQVLLLRTLETGEVQPVGSAPRQVDVRWIAATDAPLEDEAAAGRFRAPLLHRLGGYQIHAAPLRRRREDLGLLLLHFLRQELDGLGEAHRLLASGRPWVPAPLVAGRSRKKRFRPPAGRPGPAARVFHVIPHLIPSWSFRSYVLHLLPIRVYRPMLREATLSREDAALLDQLELQVEQDLDLYAWWQRAVRTNSYGELFELVPDSHGMGGITGFYDEVQVTRMGTVPIMGVIQDIFYDQVKAPAGELEETIASVCRQVKEFALRYYLRIEKRSNPQPYPELSHPGLPPILENLSLCPDPNVSRAGFGNAQLWYKLRNGLRGTFPCADWPAILDVRRVGPDFEWVVLQTEIYDFNWSWTFGASAAEAPSLEVTLPQSLHLALVPELVTNEDNPAPGILGAYGPGVAFLKASGPSLLAYGPAQIQPAFEQVIFHVYADGQIRVRIPWVTNQPRRIANFPLNPLDWTLSIANFFSAGVSNRLLDLLPGGGVLQKLSKTGPTFDPVTSYITLANAFTGGWAARDLGISRDQLKKEMLFLHCLENYHTVLGTLPVWKQTPNWLDERTLPDWIRTGRLYPPSVCPP